MIMRIILLTTFAAVYLASTSAIPIVDEQSKDIVSGVFIPSDTFNHLQGRKSSQDSSLEQRSGDPASQNNVQVTSTNPGQQPTQQNVIVNQQPNAGSAQQAVMVNQQPNQQQVNQTPQPVYVNQPAQQTYVNQPTQGQTLIPQPGQ
ncbi:unnamed protein product [Pieris macdunnoughi]|uniref:Uncharacterized protein n=1 Tax=Pieris macdunnoughi TaxID=345717 RepID=A0A821LK61_9NEOP|nr:unnamed protein product [Pieris macdunnoughi]